MIQKTFYVRRIERTGSDTVVMWLTDALPHEAHTGVGVHLEVPVEDERPTGTPYTVTFEEATVE